MGGLPTGDLDVRPLAQALGRTGLEPVRGELWVRNSSRMISTASRRLPACSIEVVSLR